MKFENIIYSDESPKNRYSLYLPKVSGSALYIFFHGGALVGGEPSDDAAMFDALNKNGIAVASAGYRLYPEADFPDFISDAACAVAKICSDIKNYGTFDEIYIGGSSAGAYIAMMLFFDKSHLAKYGISRGDFAGFIFDAGQPTTHFNILAHSGQDERLVRIDKAAPLFYITEEIDYKGRIKIIVADGDMLGRLEQNMLLKRTMLIFGFDENRLDFDVMNGFGHCGYCGEAEYFKMISDFILDRWINDSATKVKS